MRITVLDTETTGLDHKIHELIQLALIEMELLENGELKILKEHEYKIAPKRLEIASKEALLINGYTEERWANALPNIFSIVPELDNIWTTSDLLLGQNLIFDLRYITKAYHQLGLMRPVYPKYIDTKHMASLLVKEGILKSSSMDPMCEFFKIKFKGNAHDALVDCHRTIDVWQRLQKYTDEQYFTFKDPYDPHANKDA